MQAVGRAELEDVARRIVEAEIDAVTVCFLNAYINPSNESTARDLLQALLPAGTTISTSSQLLPQIQEYERTSTTVINAYLRPIIERYVTALEARLQRLGIRVPLMIMQSSGGVLPGAEAGRNPVTIIESARPPAWSGRSASRRCTASATS
jgi:N-methylhydantoinase A